MRVEDLGHRVGQEIGVTDWITIDQLRIGVFAECTEDRQWIHTEPKRAMLESPFGAPVAHGFLTLSLLTHFQELGGVFPSDAQAVVNYGLDNVRFLNPVRSGARIRNRATLKSLNNRVPGEWRMTLSNTTEIEDEEKPAMVADSVLLIIQDQEEFSGQGGEE